MINTDNLSIFQKTIADIYKKYDLDIKDTTFGKFYSNILFDNHYVREILDHNPEVNKMVPNTTWLYIKPLFRDSSYKLIYLYKCTKCGKYRLNRDKPDIIRSKMCKKCNNTDSMYDFISDYTERVKFNDLINNMYSRCYSTSHQRYHVYGGRGIGICDEWRVLEPGISLEEKYNRAKILYTFLKEHGWCPGKQIDRIDNNQGYNPNNVRVVTALVNLNNRSSSMPITYNGLTKTAAGWQRFADCGIDHDQLVYFNYNLEEYLKTHPTFREKLKDAFIEYSITGLDRDKEAENQFKVIERVDSIKNYTYRGRYLSKSDWARACNIGLSTFDFAFRKSGNNLEQFFKDRPDMKEVMDRCIDNGTIDKYIQENPNSQKRIIKYHNMVSDTAGFGKILNVPTSQIPTMIARYNDSLENMIENKPGMLEKWFDKLDNHTKEFILIIKNYFLNNYIYDVRNKITKMHRYNSNNIIKSPDGKTYIRPNKK